MVSASETSTSPGQPVLIRLASISRSSCTPFLAPARSWRLHRSADDRLMGLDHLANRFHCLSRTLYEPGEERAQGCLGDALGIVTSALIRLASTGKASPPTTFLGASSRARLEDTGSETASRRKSIARGPAPLGKPGAVIRHLGALHGRRVPFARRRLVALVRRAPAQLDAIVHVVRHLELAPAVDHIL